jgi:hypothetical protein
MHLSLSSPAKPQTFRAHRAAVAATVSNTSRLPMRSVPAQAGQGPDREKTMQARSISETLENVLRDHFKIRVVDLRKRIFMLKPAQGATAARRREPALRFLERVLTPAGEAEAGPSLRCAFNVGGRSVR